MTSPSTDGPSDGESSKLLEVFLSRQDLIEAVTREPRSKPQLVEASGRSRSTVDRGVRTLEKAGIMTRESNGQYELTLFGTVLTREVERTLGRLGALARIRSFFDDAALTAHLDPALFEGATIETSDGLGISAALASFADATEVRLVDPPVGIAFLGIVEHAGPSLAAETTVVVRSDVLTEIAEYNPRIVEAYREQGIELYETDDHLPFSFALLSHDGRPSLCLILGTGHDGLVLVETAAPTAVAWGESRYEQSLANARAVAPSPQTHHTDGQ